MNCKQGDLAIVVGSRFGNNGKIVRCLRIATQAELDDWWHIDTEGPVWIIDRTLIRSGGSHAPLVRDRLIRPIRPDETPEESTEAMRRLHEMPVKEPVVKPYKWVEL